MKIIGSLTDPPLPSSPSSVDQDSHSPRPKPATKPEPPKEPVPSTKPVPPTKPKPPTTPEATLSNATSWSYDPVTDSRRYGLSYAQCNSAFSDLYREIDRAVAHRKNIGNVTPDDLSLHWKKDGAIRAMIYDQKLYVLESKFSGSGYDSTRALATLHALDRAITSSPEPLPNVEFSFAVSDISDPKHAHRTVWSLSRLAVDEETWLMPDFGYWSWPLDLIGEYDQVRSEIQELEVPWNDKIPKALWRGALDTNKVRPALVEVTRGKPWADVEEVRWKNRTDISANSAGSALAIADHCKYQFLIQTEGRSYSGRGKYLLNCESITIIHKSEWIEPHQHLLVSSGPRQNFVEVERDFSDLERKIEELLHDSKRATLIASNSVSTFRDKYLAPAAQSCYWRQLIRSWAGVSFEPERYEMIDGKRHGRGTPFETFALRTVVKSMGDCSFWKKITFQC